MGLQRLAFLESFSKSVNFLLCWASPNSYFVWSRGCCVGKENTVGTNYWREILSWGKTCSHGRSVKPESNLFGNDFLDEALLYVSGKWQLGLWQSHSNMGGGGSIKPVYFLCMCGFKQVGTEGGKQQEEGHKVQVWIQLGALACRCLKGNRASIFPNNPWGTPQRSIFAPK